jgi:hypothetical protein
MGRKFGFSFSWKRALGISAPKARLSRQLGVPLTRSGRQRKAGRALGCLVLVVAGFVSLLAALVARTLLAHP